MGNLIELKCVPCRGEVPAATREEIVEYHKEVPDWELVERDGIEQLERVFKFGNFIEALAFTNKVGDLAEQEGHHPAILTEWGKATVTWWTHAIPGLHKNDFIAAAKTDQVYRASH
jgi:4a-hydroxytetrahydrobiopterin dehydratase